MDFGVDSMVLMSNWRCSLWTSLLELTMLLMLNFVIHSLVDEAVSTELLS